MEHNKKLILSNSFEDDQGTWGDLKLEKKLYNYIDKNDLFYTKKDLKKAINHVVDFKIKDILLFNNIYNNIEKIAGFREKNILKNCIFTTLEAGYSDTVLNFYDINLNYFSYDVDKSIIIN